MLKPDSCFYAGILVVRRVHAPGNSKSRPHEGAAGRSFLVEVQDHRGSASLDWKGAYATNGRTVAVTFCLESKLR